MIRVPKLVDCHVHFREPGLTHKGDMLSESMAAFFGGISVACDMPNTNPPTQTIQALKDKIELSTRASGFCDLRFFFGATAMEHLAELEKLWTDPVLKELKRRCCGLKLYLDNSTGDMKSDDSVTAAAFELCGRLQDITLVTHCEDTTTNQRCSECIRYTAPRTHSDRRPPVSEETSIRDALTLASRFNTKLHIAHLSTAGGLDAVREAKKRGLPVTCEVTPHHLFLTIDDYDLCGTNVKVNPPVRPIDHRDSLWLGLCDGTVDCVATDHAPHTEDEKRDSVSPPSGIPGVELVLSLMLTACSGRWPHPTTPAPHCWSALKLSHADIVRWMHTNPNRIFDLQLSDEPTTAIDTALTWQVMSDRLHSKVKWTPYDNWTLTGRAVVE